MMLIYIFKNASVTESSGRGKLTDLEEKDQDLTITTHDDLLRVSYD